MPTDAPPHIDADGADASPAVERRRVPPWLERAAAYSWRLLAIGAAVVAGLWLVGQLLVVVIPVAVAALLARALSPLDRRLERVGLRPALAAAVTMLVFIAGLALAATVVGSAVAGQLDDLGPTLQDAVDDLSEWLVENGPGDISEADVARWREQIGESLSRFVQSGDQSLVSGAVVAAEVVIGAVLGLIVAFFMLKDGHRFVDRVVRGVPARRRDVTRRAGDRAWEAAGAYLKGAALLGAVEAVAIGVAMLIAGSELIAPVMLVTFLAAFVPIVGAVVAGIIAVLVTLVTAGTVPALIVGGVALLVQQLDNDLLAPVIYGRALRLHPLVILLGIAAGGSLFGFVGTFLAVPVLAVTLSVVDEVRHDDRSEVPPVT